MAINKIEAMHIFFAIDVSGSMNGEKIEQVNNFMESILSECRNMYDHRIPLLGHILTFGDGARWIAGGASSRVYLSDMVCAGLAANEKRTETAKAIRLLADKIKEIYSKEQALSVIILLTDGKCTELPGEYKKAVAGLKLACKDQDLRIPVSINGADEGELEAFGSDPAGMTQVMEIRDVENICNSIRTLYNRYLYDQTDGYNENEWVG